MSKFMLKGQTNAFVIVFFVVIMLGAAMFFFMIGKSIDTTSQDEYMNIYSNSLLITLLNTDTGFLGSNCEKISDIAFNSVYSFYPNNCKCTSEGVSRTCSDLLEETIGKYFSNDPNTLSFRKENLDYCLVFSVGDKEKVFPDPCDLRTKKTQKWTSEITMFKRGGSSKLITQFIVASKD